MLPSQTSAAFIFINKENNALINLTATTKQTEFHRLLHTNLGLEDNIVSRYVKQLKHCDAIARKPDFSCKDS